MTADEVDLELLELVGWNVDVGEFPKAGADAVNNGLPPNDFVNDTPGGMNGRVTRRRKLDRLLFEGDAGDLRERKRTTLKLQHALECVRISGPAILR
jgi:hypothetical protein